MGLKKRSKVSAEFSMSSLTDIIFLLLIFFMLTSSLVAPNALNLKFPGQSNSPSMNLDKTTEVTINKRGKYYLDGRISSTREVQKVMQNLARGKRGKKADIAIAPHPDAPVESVARIMDFAMRYNINAILASEK